VEKHAFMRACCEGGEAIEEALRSLDRSYHAGLYRECRRSIRDAAAARDIVQETFIKVWQRCATFKGDSELLPWIRSILRHGILDRLRRLEREVPIEKEDEWAGGSAAASIEFSARAVMTPEDEEHRRRLRECFARCWAAFENEWPAHAAVMAWIAEDGLSHEEIAALLGRTPGATREFISQCRKRARIHLAEWHELAFGER
jgi:RNA polymerase sigma factor (sigma-70 family)